VFILEEGIVVGLERKAEEMEKGKNAKSFCVVVGLGSVLSRLTGWVNREQRA